LAYTFIPSSVEEIYKEISNRSIAADVSALYEVCCSIGNTLVPISLDLDNPKKVKVTRKINLNSEEVSIILRGLNLNVKPGEGSRGNRGINSAGFWYEEVVRSEIDKALTKDISDGETFKVAKEVIRLEGVSGWGTAVLKTGKVSRPINFGSCSISVGNPNYHGFIGHLVGDVEVFHSNGTSFFISVKYGPHITLFNSGICSVFNRNEIQSGEIKNSNGCKLLQCIGVDSEKMCKQFSGPGLGEEYIDPKLNEYELEKFIESGIGRGYYLVRGWKNGSAECGNLCEVKPGWLGIDGITVKYPSNSRRVTVKVNTTAKGVLELVIRSKTGTDYPTHILCDHHDRR